MPENVIIAEPVALRPPAHPQQWNAMQ